MNLIFELVAGILRGVAKVAVIALAAGFALAVVCGALVWVALAILRYVFTGRKPAVVSTFTQFRNGAQQFRTGRWATGGGNSSTQDSTDIVDVQAHEIRTVPGVSMSPKTHD